MALLPPANTTLRHVHGVSSNLPLIEAYLLGAVYCWIKNKPKEPFCLRDLVGGENWDWNGTPIKELFNKHTNAGKTNCEAIGAAAIDAGWILKSVLHNDKRHFHVLAGYTKIYKWTGNEP